MPSDVDAEEITHAAVCGGCDRDTYMYERYCHLCGHDRWGQK